MDQWFLLERMDWLTPLVFYFTELAEWRVVMVLAIVSLVYFWRKKEMAKMVGLAVSSMGSVVTVFIMKNWIARPRPMHSVYTESLASFPSFHATAAVAFYGLLFYFLISGVANKTHQKIYAIFTALFILFIGFSRLYLGVHFLSDVVAGYLVGIVWLALGVLIAKKYSKNKNIS